MFPVPVPLEERAAAGAVTVWSAVGPELGAEHLDGGKPRCHLPRGRGLRGRAGGHCTAQASAAYRNGLIALILYPL